MRVDDIQIAILDHQPLGNVPVCLCQPCYKPHTGGFIDRVITGDVRVSSGGFILGFFLDLTVQKRQ